MAERIHMFFQTCYQEMIKKFVDFMLIDFVSSTTKNILERKKMHILQNLKSYKTIVFFDEYIDNLQITIDFITNDKDMLQIVADIFNSKDHETFMAKQKENIYSEQNDDEDADDDDEQHSETSSWERYELADYGKYIYIVDTETLNENGEYKILTKANILKKYLIELLFVNDKDRQKTGDYIEKLLISC